MQRLQPFILRREPAFRRGVDDQQHLPAQRSSDSGLPSAPRTVRSVMPLMRTSQADSRDSGARRPFAVQDRIDDAVAQSPADDLMAAQHTVPLCAQPFDRTLAADVERIGADLHALYAHRVEGMRQQQPLRLGIHAGALDPRRIEGAADLQTPMAFVHPHVARGADNCACRVADREYQRPPLLDLRERGGKPAIRVLQLRHARVEYIPQVIRRSDGDQARPCPRRQAAAM